MNDILIYLILGAAWIFLPKLLSKLDDNKKRTPKKSPAPAEKKTIWQVLEDVEQKIKEEQQKREAQKQASTQVVEDGEVLQKKKEKIPKQAEYFTYDNMDIEEDLSKDECVKDSVFDTQISDNEEKRNIDLSFDENEIYKGIIYSEILKRKYN